MPLAFASTLGGTLTMIGSAANLLASDCATLADLRGSLASQNHWETQRFSS